MVSGKEADGLDLVQRSAEHHSRRSFLLIPIAEHLVPRARLPHEVKGNLDPMKIGFQAPRDAKV